MQCIKSLFLAGLFLLIGKQVFAQSDYVTITVEHCPPEIVYISENGENYIKKTF